MAKGISIHIGLNKVDPAHYDGWDGALSGCINDANDMLAIAKKKGFASVTLLDEQATAKAVTKAIADAAKRLSAGDILLFTYSGHGGQVRDTNHDEKDRRDETLCLYDRELVDDELYTLWKKFKKGVRIFMLSDSCHSGSNARGPRPSGEFRRRRGMPRQLADRVYAKHKKLYDDIQKKNAGSERARVGASLILISGCMDNQTSADGARNGLFTETLKKVYRNGAFKYGYERLRGEIVQLMPPDQTPNYYLVGTKNPTFENQKPFSI